MAVTSHYLLMGVFIAVIVCMSITTPLRFLGKISIEAACLSPMLILCFVFTPISWFTFDGLLGSTPYLSILFIAVIALTYYSKIQTLILSLYSTLLLGLVIHFLFNMPENHNDMNVFNILMAYVLTSVLIVVIIEGVKRKNSEINRQSAELSMRDDLTGLLNRRAIRRLLDGIERSYLNDGTEYAMVMLDIDDFKHINDLNGHNFGDVVLKNLAECIEKSIRPTDHSFRYGGDEFLLVLPHVDGETVRKICHRIQTTLNEVHGNAFSVNVSMGHALRSESSSITGVLELADRRMYDTKRGQSDADSGEDAAI